MRGALLGPLPPSFFPFLSVIKRRAENMAGTGRLKLWVACPSLVNISRLSPFYFEGNFFQIGANDLVISENYCWQLDDEPWG